MGEGSCRGKIMKSSEISLSKILLEIAAVDLNESSVSAVVYNHTISGLLYI